jgi:cation transport ATPase
MTTDLRVRHPRPGRVELISWTLFSDRSSPFCHRFVTRLFSVPEVESLVIDRNGAEIRYSAGGTALPRLMRRIAAALGGNGGGGSRTEPLHLSAPAGLPVCVRRYGAVLSTWEVRHALPGRFRLRHRSLRGHRWIADALLEELATAPGVLECRVGLHTGSLLIVHDPRRLGHDELLRLCESALQKAGANTAAAPSLAKFGVGTLLLTLAISGYYVYPPLLVACALLLVAANVDTFGRAWRSLRGGKLDVDVAYCTLITLALFAGDFRSIALTAWCVRSWPLLLDRRLATTRHALAGGRPRVESLVRVQRSGRELAVPVASLKPGDVTVVETGATLPADGVVLEGVAAVDERWITGEPGMADKKPGLAVYAGARVATGRLVVEVTRSEHDAVATEMRRRVLDATRVTLDDATPGHVLADRAAPPVLAFSAIGGLTGGLGTSMAVLAPNYYAAPGLHPLHRSSTLLACADAGFLVRDEAALSRLAAAEAVVIGVAVGEADAEALVSGLRARGIERILLLSPPGAVDAAGMAGRVRLLRKLRRDGVRTAFIGHGDDRVAAREAGVAVAIGGSSLPAADAADVVLVSSRVARTLELFDLARAHARETRLNHRLGLWPNVLAVSSALVIGSPSLFSSFLTNLGALTVYVRGSQRLSGAEAVWRANRR